MSRAHEPWPLHPHHPVCEACDELLDECRCSDKPVLGSMRIRPPENPEAMHVALGRPQ